MRAVAALAVAALAGCTSVGGPVGAAVTAAVIGDGSGLVTGSAAKVEIKGHDSLHLNVTWTYAEGRSLPITVTGVDAWFSTGYGCGFLDRFSCYDPGFDLPFFKVILSGSGHLIYQITEGRDDANDVQVDGTGWFTPRDSENAAGYGLAVPDDTTLAAQLWAVTPEAGVPLLSQYHEILGVSIEISGSR
jgi:hypothetical protein